MSDRKNGYATEVSVSVLITVILMVDTCICTCKIFKFYLLPKLEIHVSCCSLYCIEHRTDWWCQCQFPTLWNDGQWISVKHYSMFLAVKGSKGQQEVETSGSSPALAFHLNQHKIPKMENRGTCSWKLCTVQYSTHDKHSAPSASQQMDFTPVCAQMLWLSEAKGERSHFKGLFKQRPP